MSKLQTPNPKPRVYVATGTSPGTWSPEISGQPMVQPAGRIIPWITLGKKDMYPYNGESNAQDNRK